MNQQLSWSSRSLFVKTNIVVMLPYCVSTLLIGDIVIRCKVIGYTVVIPYLNHFAFGAFTSNVSADIERKSQILF